MKYAYTVEYHKGNYWGSVVDLQVCVGVGRTRDELDEDIRAAIETWVESHTRRGYDVPNSVSTGDAEAAVSEETVRLIADFRSKRTGTGGFFSSSNEPRARRVLGRRRG